MTDTLTDGPAVPHDVADAETDELLEEYVLPVPTQLPEGRTIVDDTDPAYLACLRAIYGLAEFWQCVNRADAAGYAPREHYPDDYLAELAIAFAEGKRHLLDRDDSDREPLRRDLGALDEQALADLEATLGRVAPHLGVEIDWPDRGAGEGGA